MSTSRAPSGGRGSRTPKKRFGRPFHFTLPRKLIVGVGGVLILVVGLYAGGRGIWGLMSRSHVFQLNKIVVRGTERLSQDEALRLTGLTSQDNILSIKLDAIRQAIMADPWIKSAKISRQWPDKLIIDVVEHTPVAAIGGKKTFLVDRSGQLFQPKDSVGEARLPEISGVNATDLDRGRLTGADRSALELIFMASRGTRTLGSGNIDHIEVLKDGSLMLYTIDPGVAFHFASDELRTQFDRAEKILYHLYRSGTAKDVTRIDLNYGPERALATLKNEG